jgi:hypothetical protein
MVRKGDTGGAVVMSVEHTEGHETMYEGEISDLPRDTGLLLRTNVKSRKS